MKVMVNAPSSRFRGSIVQPQEAIVVFRSPANGGRRGSMGAVRIVGRDFQTSVRPGGGVPRDRRFGNVRVKFPTTPGAPQMIDRFSGMGIGRDEQFFLQTGLQTLATFGGTFLGTKLGTQSAFQTIGSGTTAPGKGAGQGVSPAIASLASDAAKAAGATATADLLAQQAKTKQVVVAPKKPVSDTTKILVGGGAALLLLKLAKVI